MQGPCVYTNYERECTLLVRCGYRYPTVFGACFFFWPGVWLMVIENANTDLEMRRHNWRVHGEKGKRPGYVMHCVLPTPPSLLPWVGLVLRAVVYA